MQDGDNKAAIRNSSYYQGAREDDDECDKHQLFDEACVCAGQLQQQGSVTVKVVHDIGATKGQLCDHNGGRKHGEKAQGPAAQDQLQAESAVHDGCVMQRVANGNKAVQGHHCHVENCADTQAVEKQHLKEATRQGNHLPLCQEAIQGAGKERGGESDFQKGKIPEEVVHRGLKEVIHKGDGDDRNVSKQDQEIGNAKEQEEGDIQMAAASQSQEDKFHYSCVVH